MSRVKLVKGDAKTFTICFYNRDGTLKDLTNLTAKFDYSIESNFIGTITGTVLNQTLYKGQAQISLGSASLDSLTDSYGTLQGEPYLEDGSGNTDRDYDFIWIDLRQPLGVL